MRVASRLLSIAALAALCLGLTVGQARAIPAFARQTGADCVACHVGGFGPQYTAFGRAFKLRGYVDGDAVSPFKQISVTATAGYEQADRTLPAGTPGHADNDAWAADDVSLFFGGRLLEHAGMLAQASYSDALGRFSWGNLDLRYADTGSLGGRDLLYGVSLNNNPTVQDVWQSAPAWSFPYATARLAPAPAPRTLPALENGSLAGRSLGASLYGLWDDWLYAEFGGYAGLALTTQQALGEAADLDRMRGASPYWRLAVQHETGVHYMAIGTYGLDAGRASAEGVNVGLAHTTDIAVDGTYQANLVDGEHVLTAYGSLLHEALRPAGGGAAGDDHLLSMRLTTAYDYDNTWGVTASRFTTWGNADAAYFGTASGKPNSAGWTVELDMTPFGKPGSFAAPNVNLRLFVQYTIYDRFDGGATNYDGHGRNAADNNTLYAGTWLAF